MVSVNSNVNYTSLASLRQISADLSAAQNRIATGLKVASAKDNPSVWAAATTLRSDVSRNQALIDAMTPAKSIADSASAGLDSIASALTEIASLTATMSAAGTATDAQKAQLTGLQNKINAAITGASNGATNLLTSTSAVTAGIGYKTDGTLTLATYAANVITSDADMTAVLNASPDLSDTNKIIAYAGKVANAQSKIATAAANVGSFSGSLDAATSFLGRMNDIRQTAIGSMVNTDMEKESAMVQALQVKQQLAYQALAISSSSAQNILRLFQ